MAILALIYAAYPDGSFTDADGKSLHMPESDAFIQDLIQGKPVICGARSFFKDWPIMLPAAEIAVLSHYKSLHPRTDEEQKSFAAFQIRIAGLRKKAKEEGRNPWKPLVAPLAYVAQPPIAVLAAVKARNKQARQFFCLGGKQAILAFAPFASRVYAALPAQWDKGNFGDAWLPPFIREQIGRKSENQKETALRPRWAYEYFELPFPYAIYERITPIEI